MPENVGEEMVQKSVKRDGHEHVIPDELVFSRPTGEEAVSFKKVPASYEEYFTLVRRAETSWIARQVEHLGRVAVCVSQCGNEIVPKKHSRQDRDVAVVSNALCRLSAAECGTQFDCACSQGKTGNL